MSIQDMALRMLSVLIGAVVAGLFGESPYLGAILSLVWIASLPEKGK